MAASEGGRGGKRREKVGKRRRLRKEGEGILWTLGLGLWVGK